MKHYIHVEIMCLKIVLTYLTPFHPMVPPASGDAVVMINICAMASMAKPARISMRRGRTIMLSYLCSILAIPWLNEASVSDTGHAFDWASPFKGASQNASVTTFV